MKAYLVNLDSAEDRLAQFDAQARALGFAYERVSAVDGRTPAFAASLGERSPGPILGRVIAPGEVACFESHRKIWRMIVDSGDSHAIILEDDAILKPGFEKYVSDGWAPPGVDIIRLETWAKPVHLDRAAAYKAHGRAMYRLRSGTFGTAAYAISADCAARLLDQTARIEDPVDEVMFRKDSPIAQSLVTYQMTPAPARQAQFFADDEVQAFAVSSLAGARGEDQRLGRSKTPWWRPFPDMHNPSFKDIRSMAYWMAKDRIKGVFKGTRFMFVPFG